MAFALLGEAYHQGTSRFRENVDDHQNKRNREVGRGDPNTTTSRQSSYGALDCREVMCRLQMFYFFEAVALIWSRFNIEIKSMLISLGHAVEHSPMLVQ